MKEGSTRQSWGREDVLQFRLEVEGVQDGCSSISTLFRTDALWDCSGKESSLSISSFDNAGIISVVVTATNNIFKVPPPSLFVDSKYPPFAISTCLCSHPKPPLGWALSKTLHFPREKEEDTGHRLKPPCWGSDVCHTYYLALHSCPCTLNINVSFL